MLTCCGGVNGRLVKGDGQGYHRDRLPRVECRGGGADFVEDITQVVARLVVTFYRMPYVHASLQRGANVRMHGMRRAIANGGLPL